VALASAAPSLSSHKVALSLLFVVIITVVNLRGVRESGILFAVPTYGFVVVMFVMVGAGFGKSATGACAQAHVPDPIATGAGAVGVFVILRAFASGSAALTAVEAVSNGVNAFRLPAGKNAARTLLIMAGIAVTLFVSVSWLTGDKHAAPRNLGSLGSGIARGRFPTSSRASFMYHPGPGFTVALLLP